MFRFLECILKIDALAFSSGMGKSIMRSNLPGLNKAGSKISIRFVAPIILTSPRSQKFRFLISETR